MQEVRPEHYLDYAHHVNRVLEMLEMHMEADRNRVTRIIGWIKELEEDIEEIKEAIK